MEIRELLQTEIWSKETSRKILAPAKRYLVPSKRVVVRVGVALGIIVAVAGIALTIEMLWMTNGERRVAAEALSEIDALQSLVPTGGMDFKERDLRAREKIDQAARAAWTFRDRGAAFYLSFYLNMTEQDQQNIEMEMKLRRIVEARGGTWRSSQGASEEAAQRAQFRLEFRSAVLKALR